MKLAGCFRLFGIYAEQRYVFLVEVGHLKFIYTVGIELQIALDSSCNTSCSRKSVCLTYGCMLHGIGLFLRKVYFVSIEYGGDLFKSHHIVHCVVTAGFFALSYAWSHEHDFRFRVFLLGDSRCVVHGGACLGYVFL